MIKKFVNTETVWRDMEERGHIDTERESRGRER